MAITAGVPIVPICCSNYKSSMRLNRWHSGPLRIRALPPLPTAGMTLDDMPALMERCREQMVVCIDALNTAPTLTSFRIVRNPARVSSPVAPVSSVAACLQSWHRLKHILNLDRHMPFFTIRPTRLFTLAACLLAAASLTAQAEQVAFAKLKALQAAPESAGTLVYRGDTFTQRTPVGAPLYRYERRVLATAKGLSASLTDS